MGIGLELLEDYRYEIDNFNNEKEYNMDNKNEKARDTFLEAKKNAQEIAKMYSTDKKQQSFNLLLLGEMGQGKTFLTRTARKPIHIDSFDPGGTKGLEDYIAKGDIIVDTRYESEDPVKPTMTPIWVSEMDKRIKSNYFDHIGTYVIDSSTTWSDMLMNNILKKAGIAGQQPRWAHDYGPQKTLIRNYLKICLDLPCDFILTGHLKTTVDEGAGGKTIFRFATTGQGVVTIPTMFDEIWNMTSKDTSDGLKYRILTQSTGTYACRSRLAKDGLLDKFEEPDIKAILKKVGKDVQDKPKLL